MRSAGRYHDDNHPRGNDNRSHDDDVSHDHHLSHDDNVGNDYHLSYDDNVGNDYHLRHDHYPRHDYPCRHADTSRDARESWRDYHDPCA